ncbi:MAG: TlpA family protein disulfide reductase [Acidimicrobiia bacterium]
MPELDTIAAGYRDEVYFLAVAGRSTLDKSRERAAQWFSDNLAWGYDESIWELFGVHGQPVTILITGDDQVYTTRYGQAGEKETRAAIEDLLALSG